MFQSDWLHLTMRSTSTATVRRVRAAPDRMPRKGVKCRGTVWDSTWGGGIQQEKNIKTT